MFRHLHRAAARVVDEVGFGAINLLHARQRPARDFAARLDAYVGGWRQATMEEYLAVPQETAAEAALAALDFQPPAPGQRGRLRFPSPLPGAHPANGHAVYDLYAGPAGWSAPTLLLTHGLMSVSDAGYRYWAARWNKAGWNVVFVHLPYHYARRPRGTFSGELCVTADLLRTVEGARQAVVELRMLLRWLAAQGGTRFAGWGTSYGAWVLGLLGCVEPLLAESHLALIEPILDIDAAVWHSPACAVLRRWLRRRGVTPEMTAPHMRLCSPLHAGAPALPPERVLLLAGQYDRVAPPGVIRALHEKWRGSHFYEFPQGHIGYRLLPESFRLAGELWGGEFSAVSGPP
ncbi:MAG: hypothetical protein PW734_04025 [Verrucomicrobium sp.]|nr:hypothetical protein [Verrucomicrobium sp.]